MTVIRKSKLPLEKMTILDREAEIKRRQSQEQERIEVLGQDSEEKALPWIQQEVKNEEQQKQNYFNSMMELLSHHLKDRPAYIRLLTQIFIRFAAEESIPKKYQVEIEANDIGVVVSLPKFKRQRAFKASGLPSYDFRACQMMAIMLGNTVAKLEGNHHTSQGGIILPDAEDVQVYGL